MFEFADDIVSAVLLLEIGGVQNCEDFLHVGNNESGHFLLVLDVLRVGLNVMFVGVLRVLREEGRGGDARATLTDGVTVLLVATYLDQLILVVRLLSLMAILQRGDQHRLGSVDPSHLWSFQIGSKLGGAGFRGPKERVGISLIFYQLILWLISLQIRLELFKGVLQLTCRHVHLYLPLGFALLSRH